MTYIDSSLFHFTLDFQIFPLYLIVERQKGPVLVIPVDLSLLNLTTDQPRPLHNHEHFTCVKGNPRLVILHQDLEMD